MKKLLVVGSILMLSACAKNEAQRVQNLNDAEINLEDHAEKVQMAKQFCNGEGFRYYSEGKYSYYFTCKDGTHWKLKKSEVN